MNKRALWAFSFLTCVFLYGENAAALTPLQGIIKGGVEDVGQYDPLEDIFTHQFFTDKTLIDQKEKEKIEFYKAAFKQGANLVNACGVERFYTYPASWAEEGAKRSVAATLQYLGLDYSVRAIVEYANAFKLNEAEFENVVNNLVENNCSENITVFSKKLLKNNFFHLRKSGSSFETPKLDRSPYFASKNAQMSSSLKAKEREFNFTLKNFRAFCSWDGNVDNYGMLAPYLQNPFVMAWIFNHMTQKKMEWDQAQEAVVLKPVDDSILVACEDMICRRRNFPAFSRLFPRMTGSSTVKDDLNVLYCNHFRETGLKAKDASPTVATWIQNQTLEESRLEPMNFLALLTGIPDLFFSADSYEDLTSIFSTTIEHRWNQWAQNKTSELITDLLYEESLFIDLVPSGPRAKASGELGVVFDFTLGELDRELSVVDKVSSTFHMEFPKSYLRWLRQAYIQANNKSQFKKMEDLTKKFQTYLDLSLAGKERLFLIPMWNENFSSILASELIEQLTGYGGSRFEDFSHETVKIPVRFRFGLFALKYLRDKFKTKYHVETLTFNK